MATILLADDDAAVRDLVRRALSADGHTVHVTQDGLEALDYINANGGSIDLLVTDVDMPQLDGISLAEHALTAKSNLAVVLMSGFSDQLERAAPDSELWIERWRLEPPFQLEEQRPSL